MLLVYLALQWGYPVKLNINEKKNEKKSKEIQYLNSKRMRNTNITLIAIIN